MVVSVRVISTAFAFVTMATACVDEHKLPPAQWQKHDVLVGAIYLPGEFEQTSSHELIEFESPTMKIYVDGRDENIASPAGRAADVERDSGLIDGHPAEYYSFTNPSEGNMPGASLGDWKVAAIEPRRSEIKIVIWTTYSEIQDAATADGILKYFDVY